MSDPRAGYDYDVVINGAATRPLSVYRVHEIEGNIQLRIR